MSHPWRNGCFSESKRAAWSDPTPSRRRASARTEGPSGRPRSVEGATSTLGVWRRRFTFPVASQVRKNAVSPTTTTCTGVATAVPSRRNVVSWTYVAPESEAKYPDSPGREESPSVSPSATVTSPPVPIAQQAYRCAPRLIIWEAATIRAPADVRVCDFQGCAATVDPPVERG